LKSTIVIFLIICSLLSAQDSIKIQAFRDDFPQQKRIIKAKYPSYSLIAGYILVSDANKGDPFAEHELGIRYLTGNGFSKDTVKAIYWIRKAADLNLPAARFNYGIMLYNGIGVPWNPFEAYHNWKIASDAGLPDAQFAVGILFTDNLTLTRDYNKAYQFFKQSASAKYKPAEEALQQVLKSGFIPPNDSIIYAAKRKVDDSNPILNPNWDLDFYDFTTKSKDTSDTYIRNILSDKKDNLKNLFGIESADSTIADTTANGLLNLAAKNGSPEALVIVARIYEKGFNVKIDLAKAAANYLRAFRLGSYKAANALNKMVQDESFMNILKERINKNDADAMYAWAGIAAVGFNNQIANQQALDFLKKAVEHKHIPSIIEFGLLYMTGTLVIKDEEKAFSYWKMAKDLGSREAEVRIALAKIMEDPKSPNNSLEVQTLQRISDEGSVFAQAALAYCYEKGIGVREEKGIAVKLYRHASQRGNQAAFSSLKRMYDEVRPDDEIFKIFETDQ
jgi:uncharacterized protein